MNKNSFSFFAESITLPNGVSILTDVGCDLLIISFPNFDFEYFTAENLFAECDIDNLNYEKHVEILNNENVTEDEITAMMKESRDSALKSF